MLRILNKNKNKEFMKYRVAVLGDLHITEYDDLFRFKALMHTFKKVARTGRKFTHFIQTGDLGDYGFFNKFGGSPISKTAFNIACQDQFLNLNRYLDIVDPVLDPMKIKKIQMLGNHDQRHPDYLSSLRLDFSDKMSIEVQLKTKERNWQVIQYRQDYNLNGVSFVHAPMNGNGKPITGIYAGNKALDIYSNSVVYGHLHRFNVTMKARKNSPISTALCVGCFVADEASTIGDREAYKDGRASYLEGSANDHWRGFVVLEMDSDRPNEFTFTNYTYEQIIDDYKKSIK